MAWNSARVNFQFPWEVVIDPARIGFKYCPINRVLAEYLNINTQVPLYFDPVNLINVQNNNAIAAFMCVGGELPKCRISGFNPQTTIILDELMQAEQRRLEIDQETAYNNYATQQRLLTMNGSEIGDPTKGVGTSNFSKYLPNTAPYNYAATWYPNPEDPYDGGGNQEKALPPPPLTDDQILAKSQEILARRRELVRPETFDQGTQAGPGLPPENNLILGDDPIDQSTWKAAPKQSLDYETPMRPINPNPLKTPSTIESLSSETKSPDKPSLYQELIETKQFDFSPYESEQKFMVDMKKKYLAWIRTDAFIDLTPDERLDDLKEWLERILLPRNYDPAKIDSLMKQFKAFNLRDYEQPHKPDLGKELQDLLSEKENMLKNAKSDDSFYDNLTVPISKRLREPEKEEIKSPEKIPKQEPKMNEIEKKKQELKPPWNSPMNKNKNKEKPEPESKMIFIPSDKINQYVNTNASVRDEIYSYMRDEYEQIHPQKNAKGVTTVYVNPVNFRQFVAENMRKKEYSGTIKNIVANSYQKELESEGATNISVSCAEILPKSMHLTEEWTPLKSRRNT